VSTCNHEFIKHGDGYRCPKCFAFITTKQYRESICPDGVEVDPGLEAEYQYYLSKCFPCELSPKQVSELRLSFLAGIMLGMRLQAEALGPFSPKRAEMAKQLLAKVLTSSKAANRDRIA
jgi:hypothetical protein